MKGERNVDSGVEGLAWHLVNATFVPRVTFEDAPKGE
jgi:hypothetical protein